MTTYQKIMLAIGLVGLAVALLIPLVISVTPQLKKARKIFFFAATGLTLYAGAKWMPTVTYPAVGDVNYLIDRGSYVTNDYVHIDFSTVVIPTNANLYIFRKALDIAEAQWVEHLETTIGEFNPPQDIYFPTASNYNWMVFSDWTPGPAVETNGVWHAYWGLDLRRREKLIPVRTCVRIDSDVIATPKSKKDALPYDAEVEYLENTDMQRIEIGFLNADKIVIEIDVTLPLVAVPDSGIIGNNDGRSERCVIGWGVSGGRDVAYLYTRKAPNAADGNLNLWGHNAGTRHFFRAILDKTNSYREFVADGAETLTSNVCSGFSNNNTKLQLFNSDGSTTYRCRCKIHYVKIIKEEEPWVEFIPVRFTNERGDSEGAMYDRVSKRLFRNAGTGAFVIGPDKY